MRNLSVCKILASGWVVMGKARVLAEGSVNDNVEPVAWTRITKDKSRVFYTSWGYPSDFDKPQIKTLLTNGILWTLKVKKTNINKIK